MVYNVGMRKFFHFDLALFLPALLLMSLGFVTVISTSPELTTQTIIYIILGIIAFLFTKEIDYKIYKAVATPLFIAGVSFIVLPYFIGEATRGAVRWINVGSFLLQPGELVKPILIIFSASFFSGEEPLTLKKFPKFLGIIAIPLILVFKQPDLGNTIVYIFLFGSIIVASGLKRSVLLLGLVTTFGILPFFWHFLKGYQKERILTFLNPNHDPLGTGYNAIQAEIAVGSGQFFGRGLGRGTQSHLNFLPEFHTDFVFATLSEELGFVGSVLTLSAFGILLWQIIESGRRSNDRFAYLLSIGIFSQIMIQVFINIGMNIGIVPITGITLPLVSYGGSSLVATMIALGIIANIRKTNPHEEGIHIS